MPRRHDRPLGRPKGEIDRKLKAQGSVIGTMAVAAYLGVSYRELNNALVRSTLQAELGTGRLVVWKPEHVRILQVATWLTAAVPGVEMGRGNEMRPRRRIIDAIHANPPILEVGYVALHSDGFVEYTPDPPLLDRGYGAVVTHYDDLYPLDPDDVEARPEPRVDEPPPDDGFVGIDDYDPELNMNEDAPISYYEGPDTEEEAGLR